MVKVHASSGVIECFRFPLDPPVLHDHVPYSSHPIPSILDDNPECDPLLSFAFAPDRHEGLGIVLEAVPPRRHRSNSSDGPLHHEPTPNITRLEPPPIFTFRNIVSGRWEPVLSRAFPYDRGLYPVRSSRRKPTKRRSSLWWVIRILLQS